MPGLNLSEYDYLRAFAYFAYFAQTFPAGRALCVVPAHPDHGRGDRAVELTNEVTEGQPGYCCQWTPCPHGCCLSWNGHEKLYAGPASTEYLIDHVLRRGGPLPFVAGWGRTNPDWPVRRFLPPAQLGRPMAGAVRDARRLRAPTPGDSEGTATPGPRR